jgi:Na+/H+-dicarboxylate symporter
MDLFLIILGAIAVIAVLALAINSNPAWKAKVEAKMTTGEKATLETALAVIPQSIEDRFTQSEQKLLAEFAALKLHVSAVGKDIGASPSNAMQPGTVLTVTAAPAAPPTEGAKQ